MRERREMKPILYSAILWIIGLGLLLCSQNNERMFSITIIYMFITTPLIIFFAWRQGAEDV